MYRGWGATERKLIQRSEVVLFGSSIEYEVGGREKDLGKKD